MKDKEKELEALLRQEERNLTDSGRDRIRTLKQELYGSSKMD